MEELNLMVESVRLKTPPLREMVFSVTVQMPPLGESRMCEIVKRIEPALMKAGRLESGRFKVNPAAAKLEACESHFSGLRFHSGQNLFLTLENCSDALHVNFNYSILPPYSSWDEFSEKAYACYKRFVGEVKAVAIKRVAVRTIDELTVSRKRPGPVGLNEILKNAPAAIEGLGGGRIDAFEFRDSVYLAQYDLHATTLRAMKATAPGCVPNWILDTDVFYIGAIRPDDSKSTDEVLKRIRFVRHKLFFGSMGKRCREACDE